MQNGRGQEFRVAYDISGRIVETWDFEGNRETRRYDGAGRVTGQRTALGKNTREYDSAGRLVLVETPDESVALAYSASGSNTLIDNGRVRVESQHNELGLVLEEKQGTHELEVGWSGGRVSELSCDVGVGLRFEIKHGALELMQAGGTTLQFVFPRAHESLSFLGAKLAKRDHYDHEGNLMWSVLARHESRLGLGEAAIAQPGGSEQVLRVDYTYNAHGEVIFEKRSDGRTVQYELDAAGRVKGKRVEEHGAVKSEETLRYDGVGAPLLAGVRFDAQFRPAAYGGETFHYDAVGQLKRRITDAGIFDYAWDYAGNLVGVKGPEGVVELTYDGRGRRMRKVVTREGAVARSVSYVWENQTLLHEVDEVSGWARTYLRKPNSWHPFGHVDSNGDDERPCFYLCDATGAVDLAFDLDGAVVWSAERTVYGDVTPNPGAVVDVRVRFAGQHYDEDLGFVYNRMRWYDPRTGHYLSHDPLTLDAGTNPRAYVPNPTFFVDPMGESKKRAKDSEPIFAKGGQPEATGSHPLGTRPLKPTTVGHLRDSGMREPGHFAAVGDEETPGFIPCPDSDLNASGEKFSEGVRGKIDAAGARYGCHTCGSKNPLGPQADQDGPQLDADQKKVHFVPDHIAPSAFHTPRKKDGKTNPKAEARGAEASNGAVKLFPQCRVCSSRQGGLLGSFMKTSSKEHIRAVGTKLLGLFKKSP